MAECKHKYIGSSDGVTCAYCGKHWTHEEYVSLFAPKPGKQETSSDEAVEKKPRAKKTES